MIKDLKNTKESGITLVKLVLIGVILIISAEVAFMMFLQSSRKISKKENAAIKNEINLVIIDLKNQYYQDRYENNTTTVSWIDYAKEKFTHGIITSSGAIIKLEGEKVTYTNKGEKIPSAVGNIEILD